MRDGIKNGYESLRAGGATEIKDRLHYLLAHYPDQQADLHELLALINLFEQRSVEALVHLEQSLQLNPHSESARILIDALRAPTPVSRVDEVLVSIVVPLYNALDYTKQMLESFFEHTRGIKYELIIVDNASNDGTPEFIKTFASQAKLIFNQTNNNFAGACNQGARVASGKYLLFLNSDTILQPHWLEPMLELAEQDSSIGVIGNRHLFPETGTVHHAGICFDENLANSHYLVHANVNDPRVNYIRDFQAVNAACLLVRRDAYVKLAGFDETYHNGYEDVDFCLRVRGLGLRVVFTPLSTIYHFGQRSPGRNDTNERNRLIFMKRWAGKLQPDKQKLLDQDQVRIANGYSIEQLKSSSSIKVAWLSTYNQPCGIATHSADILCAMFETLKVSPNKIESVTVLAEDTPMREGQDQPYVRRCWSRFGEGLRAVLALLERERFDVLHIQYQDGIFEHLDFVGFVAACRALGLQVFITIHSSERMLERGAQAINLSTKSFVHLEQARLRFIAAGANPGQLEVITHGYWERVTPELSKVEARAQAGLGNDAKIISSFGFLEGRKGVSEMIQALPELRRKHDVYYFHVGGPHPADSRGAQYLAQCQEAIERLSMQNYVAIGTGFVPKQAASTMLFASDVLLMNYNLNRNEASGAAAFAMAHRVPLVTSAMPPFKPLDKCTLQISDELGLGGTLDLVLSSNSFARFLVEESDRYRADNSFFVLAGKLMAEYEKAHQDKLNDQIALDPSAIGTTSFRGSTISVR